MGAPIHASAFAYQGAGCLLLGPSGSGKSRLLAEALLYGALLVADDQVLLEERSGTLWASAPPRLQGVMELRGFGLIRREDALAGHAIHCVVMLGEKAPERLPEQHYAAFHGINLPALRLAPPVSVSGLLLYLRALQEGHALPTDWRP